ncbi:MAG TPA: dihydrofolate reductase family protein, partial [Paracoccaceae bacterium]|nr:dihydrofolate reductase family protein [Paracoccaceae bacterium]
TFRDMTAYWPGSAEPFAPPMNEIPKALFSRSGSEGGATTAALEEALRRRDAQGLGAPEPPPGAESWAAARVLRGALAEEIARLKAEEGKPILAHGGARFGQSLVASGLVDEYRLLVHPVALGSGLPLFSALDRPLRLRLVSTARFACGTVANAFVPASAG